MELSKDEKKMLLSFLRCWRQWTKDGAPEINSSGFEHGFGLCYAACCYGDAQLKEDQTTELRTILELALGATIPEYKSQGTSVPFNRDTEHYREETEKRIGHLNEARLAWVDKMIEDLQC